MQVSPLFFVGFFPSSDISIGSRLRQDSKNAFDWGPLLTTLNFIVISKSCYQKIVQFEGFCLIKTTKTFKNEDKRDILNTKRDKSMDFFYYLLFFAVRNK